MREQDSQTGQVEIVGMVASGRGRASRELGAFQDVTFSLLKQTLFPGSLNVVLRTPVVLRQVRASLFDGGRRMLWPARVNGKPVWIYRWHTCPLHIVELVSTTSLRQQFQLEDGDHIAMTVDREQIGTLRPWERVGWAVLWIGRRNWHYSKNKYAGFCMILRASRQHPFGGAFLVLKQVIRRIPILGTATRWAASKIRQESYHFSRADTDRCANAHEMLMTQIHNVLNFTKTSGSIYSAQQFPAGYHTLHVDGVQLRGQRDPYNRLAELPFEFNGKTVLDLGCNQGGMIHAIADKVKWAVGIDFDARMINAANRLKQAIGSNNTHFYVLDLDRDPLALIGDLMPDRRADICFVLSVCMWLKNWRRVIDFAHSKSGFLLFETNGTPRQQQEQINYVRSKYGKMDVISESSKDDPQQKNRKLLLLAEPICSHVEQPEAEISGFSRPAPSSPISER